ncbi:chondroitinase family polysaccharide lyase [Bacteroides sp.]|uniref:chondroitinase family polysaccharide lyase n=1 Tax=Bacteroides sp. TaxID=29523 RepID=UPI00258BF928|nr:chondroitinase family polysaccharide lyase [Bacteroides sp.]
MINHTLINRVICILLITLTGSTTYSQVLKHERLISFEESSDLKNITYTNSSVALSSDKYKDGEKSLMWSFQPNASLHLKKDLHFEPKDSTGKDTYLSTLSMWVYNTKANNSAMKFSFLKRGKKCSSFAMNMNFTGWRPIYVSYERDMEGTPQIGMDEIKIEAPEESGKVYFDLLITAAKVDHRHHTPDKQLPFLNKGIQNHWLILLQNDEIAPDPALYSSRVSESEITDIAIMEDRLRTLLFTPVTVNQKKIEALQKEVEEYAIVRDNNTIKGRSMFFARWAETFERLMPDWHKNTYVKRGQEYQKYFNLMNKLAINYNSSDNTEYKETLAKLFLLMYDHATDQGVAYGSGLGNASHYGYSFRGLFTSYFLMKDVLAKNGRLEEAMKTLQWYGQTNEIFIRPIKDGIDMDAFNTLSMGRICSILIMENSPSKVQYIKAFSRWIDTGCKPSPGLDGAFKADGGAFHHRNNYPAYAVGGLNGATNMLYILSRTSFAVSELGHNTVKNVLLTMRFYCNTTHFPLSMSGRHPDGKGELVPTHFARMAIAGTPDGKQELDKEMAAAYLRLINEGMNAEKPEYMPKTNNKETLEFIRLFNNAGIEAEKDPQGNLALGYGCVSVQRRSNWSAVVRGHSRYLWAAEHYLGANLYGRYLAHGSMQIMTAQPEERVSPQTSGWEQPGFNWARIPGTTAIHLPIEQMKANVLNVDKFSGFEEMLFSDEAFAGGLSHHRNNGNFGMKLHEHDKYNGSHKARKSYHFFNDKIVCLGSDIENNNANYNTETTIFQLTGSDSLFKDYWNSQDPSQRYWIDHLGTGYFIPKKEGNNLIFEKNWIQKSRYQNSGKESEGSWVNLIIDHGKSPIHQEYEYVVLPQTKIKSNQSQKIASSYQVLQKNKSAHIVMDNQTHTTSFVFFEAPQQPISSTIKSVDAPCLLMVEENKDLLDITVSNPDLALYQGASDEIYDHSGKRIERSIYSRPWIGNESKTVPVHITLEGKWMILNNNGYINITIKNNHTYIKFNCKDAASINVELQRLKK